MTYRDKKLREQIKYSMSQLCPQLQHSQFSQPTVPVPLYRWSQLISLSWLGRMPLPKDQKNTKTTMKIIPNCRKFRLWCINKTPDQQQEWKVLTANNTLRWLLYSSSMSTSQFLLATTFFTSTSTQRGPSVFVAVSDNTTKLAEFCFKIEIQIKIRVPQGRKLLFLSQATSERDREKRKKVLGNIKTAASPSARETTLLTIASCQRNRNR